MEKQVVISESLKYVINLLVEQSGAEEIWVLYKDLGMLEACAYIEGKYLTDRKQL